MAVREAGLEVAVPREGLVGRVVLTEGKVVATGAAVTGAATEEAARAVEAKAVAARVVAETAVEVWVVAGLEVEVRGEVREVEQVSVASTGEVVMAVAGLVEGGMEEGAREVVAGAAAVTAAA